MAEHDEDVEKFKQRIRGTVQAGNWELTDAEMDRFMARVEDDYRNLRACLPVIVASKIEQHISSLPWYKRWRVRLKQWWGKTRRKNR
jgi:hypothetical protein